MATCKRELVFIMRFCGQVCKKDNLVGKKYEDMLSPGTIKSVTLQPGGEGFWDKIKLWNPRLVETAFLNLVQIGSIVEENMLQTRGRI